MVGAVAYFNITKSNVLQILQQFCVVTNITIFLSMFWCELHDAGIDGVRELGILLVRAEHRSLVYLLAPDLLDDSGHHGHASPHQGMGCEIERGKAMTLDSKFIVVSTHRLCGWCRKFHSTINFRRVEK